MLVLSVYNLCDTIYIAKHVHVLYGKGYKMPKNAPITRKKFNGSISILLEERLKTLSKNIGRSMSALIDEAVIELSDKYSKEGGVTMVDELKKTNTTHVLCITNYKGGVGKTTTTAELAYLFAKKGNKQVLIIDADGQGNITQRMGCIPNQESSIHTCLEAAMERKPLQVEPYIVTTQYKGIDIIPGSNILGQDFFQGEMSAYRSRTGKNPYQKVIDAVRALQRYDLVIMDTHPAADNEIRYPMQASTDILCPVDPSDEGLNGVLSTYAQVVESREATPELRYLGAFFNRADLRTSQCRDYIPSAKEELPKLIRQINDGNDDGCVFDTIIRQSADIGKAVNYRCAVCARFHGKGAARDFEHLYDEVVMALV